MAKPLTKRRKNGQLYARRASVEEAIEVAKTQDLETLRSRLQITDCAIAAFLESEALVHLMRGARNTMNAQLMDVVFPALLKRCEANLLGKKIPGTKLTVKGFEESDKHGNQRIRVVCDCGTEKTMRATAITMKTTVDKNGKVRKPHRTCGCDSKEAFKRHIHNRAIKISKKTQRRIWLSHQEGQTFAQLAVQFPHLNAAVISEIVRWYSRNHDPSKIGAIPRGSRAWHELGDDQFPF